MEHCEQIIGFRLKAINNMIRRRLDMEFANAGLEEIVGMQGPMIGYIYRRSREQDVFQRDLEKEFNIRRSTATVMLQTLEQKGFIVREPVEHDARLKKIVLTDKAVQQHMEIRRRIDIFHEQLEQDITPEEKAQFFATLDKITRNLQ